MLFFGIASGCETIAAANGLSEPLYRTWQLTGAVWTAGWMGLGTAFLPGRTRFGCAFAFCLFLAGPFTFLTERRHNHEGAGSAPILCFIPAAILALAVAVATCFQNDRRPWIAALLVVGASVLSLGLILTTTLAAPDWTVNPATNASTADPFPGALRARLSGRLHSHAPATIRIAI